MQSRYFLTASDLTTFVNANPNITVVSICFDASSGQFVLFFNP